MQDNKTKADGRQSTKMAYFIDHTSSA